jgi:hypothetical protein
VSAQNRDFTPFGALLYFKVEVGMFTNPCRIMRPFFDGERSLGVRRPIVGANSQPAGGLFRPAPREKGSQVQAIV